ncbi:uncharacterized protein JCM10292_001710 [Rhodotorula paludigena]|uniref:uncharacterized protein n=1 Tax=Rhodotorula paludigena TaxID=86838 RepID=UPI00317B7D69
MPNVYHGYDGLSKNPNVSPQMRQYGVEMKAQVSNQFHGQHGAYHNPSTGSQGKSNAMQGMQNAQPSGWQKR